jgi:hypothetical protein
VMLMHSESQQELETRVGRSTAQPEGGVVAVYATAVNQVGFQGSSSRADSRMQLHVQLLSCPAIGSSVETTFSCFNSGWSGEQSDGAKWPVTGGAHERGAREGLSSGLSVCQLHSTARHRHAAW